MNIPVRKALAHQHPPLVAYMKHSGCASLAQALVDVGLGSSSVSLEEGIEALLAPATGEAVFLYSPPDIAAAHALAEGIEPHAFLEEWVDRHRALLGALKRHRGRWKLLEARSASHNPKSLLSVLGVRAAESGLASLLVEQRPLALERMLVAEVLKEFPETQRVAAHLAALASPVDAAPVPPPHTISEAISDYLDRRKSLLTQTELLKSAQDLSLRLTERDSVAKQALADANTRNAELCGELDELHHARAAAEARVVEHQSLLEHANHGKAVAEKATQDQSAEITELKSESELLLLQLHQVQEELESWFLKATGLEQELSVSRQAVADADARNAQLQGELDVLLHAKAVAEQLAEQRYAEIQQLHHAKAAAEALSTEHQALLEHANHAKAEAEKSSQDQLSEINELKSESELLLLQLHQVQEELESWFLKARDREEELKRVKLARDKLHKSFEDAKTHLAQTRQNKEIGEKLARERYEVIKQLRHEKRQLEKTVTELKQIEEQSCSEAAISETSSDAGTEDHALKQEPTREHLDSATIPALSEKVLIGSEPEPRPHPSRRFGFFARRKRRIKNLKKKDVELLRQSELFDREWYLRVNPDVAEAGFDPVEHYLAFGLAERRNPSAAFDSSFYIEQNPDIAAAGNNPLLHYLKHGKAEGRAARATQSG